MFRFEIEAGLALKPLELKDGNKLYQLITESRQHLRTYLPFVDQTAKPEDTLEFVKATVISNAEQKSFVTVVLVEEQIAGLVGFNQISWPNKKAEVGYWLAEPFIKRGITTKAVRAIINYAFKTLELNRITIRAAFFNKASQGVAKKLGFQQEGVIREAEWVNDQFVDHVVYGMLKRDWVPEPRSQD
ncbi:ribosomal-protein-serine acetyltransferase [Amphibacillus marinus]|uniref:Ribosomal-protein-serine acetyltransferase n=1 Tax=Amphibacillus marinus TaxID=872970 RepID=A0A1H8INA7_9BACI|nr:GNAT family protein [Amphibacillus marinus]SEN69516.1 ribosomal-protein-serine acetyltransferase [Amphibacillus marinus]